jgi:hypothetical protein
MHPLVPACQTNTGAHHLGNADPLLLTAAHSSDVLIADRRVESVSQTKHCPERFDDRVDKLLPGIT